MEILRVLPHFINGKYTRVIDSIPKEEHTRGDEWYLHGKLQKKVGYDIASAVNPVSAGYTRGVIDWTRIEGDNVTEIRSSHLVPQMYINGIIPVIVEGYEEPCKGYFWVTEERTVYYLGMPYQVWYQKGLVVFEDDRRANKYALKRYNEKSTIL